MSKKLNPNANIFSVLVHSAETRSLISELAKKTGNRNATLNDALDIGVPILYARMFGKETKAQKEKRDFSPSVGKEIKELRRAIDDLFIAHSIRIRLFRSDKPDKYVTRTVNAACDRLTKTYDPTFRRPAKQSNRPTPSRGR